MMNDVTVLLQQIEGGDPSAAEHLLPLVYEELRKLATVRMEREASGHTLQATALVHEAYVRLVKNEEAQHWSGRSHFFAAAAEAMRRILIENARRKRSAKHGGDHQRVNLDKAATLAESPLDDLLDLDAALQRLRLEDPVKADLVNLRYFAGLTLPQAAEALGISRATAERYWSYAKRCLYLALTEDADSVNS